MSKHWCFPEEREFYIQYMKHMSNDIYLAEKTMPTMRRWLTGKCLVNYDLVPHYAQYDYEEYLSKSSNQSTLVTAKMGAEMNINKISKTLKLMAQPSDYDDI